MAKIPADDVYAQWAYSELNSLEQGALYVGADDLRAKAADNVPFTELSPQERAFLLRQWRSAMARPLTHLTHGISTRRPFHPANL